MSFLSTIADFIKKKKEAKRGQKPMSIEEAGNWLKEKKDEGIAKGVKEDTKDFKPTIAPEQDREKFLQYTLSLLDFVSPGIMRKLPREAVIANGLSQKEVAKLFRILLELRISGHSVEYLAHYFHVPVKTVLSLEALAKEAVQEAIALKRKTAVPIIGG